MRVSCLLGGRSLGSYRTQGEGETRGGPIKHAGRYESEGVICAIPRWLRSISHHSLPLAGTRRITRHLDDTRGHMPASAGQKPAPTPSRVAGVVVLDPTPAASVRGTSCSRATSMPRRASTRPSLAGPSSLCRSHTAPTGWPKLLASRLPGSWPYRRTCRPKCRHTGSSIWKWTMLMRASKQAVELGGKIMRPPFDVPDVGRLGLVVDSAGAALGLMTPAENLTSDL
jgi:hypothetical protein